jgi:hypothetical protein
MTIAITHDRNNPNATPEIKSIVFSLLDILPVSIEIVK